MRRSGRTPPTSWRRQAPRLLREPPRRVLGGRPARGPSAGRVLRRMDHARRGRSVQGRPGHDGVVTRGGEGAGRRVRPSACLASRSSRRTSGTPQAAPGSSPPSRGVARSACAVRTESRSARRTPPSTTIDPSRAQSANSSSRDEGETRSSQRSRSATLARAIRSRLAASSGPKRASAWRCTARRRPCSSPCSSPCRRPF